MKEEHTLQWSKETRQTNNYLQNTTQKTNDWATRTPLRPVGELVCYSLL